MPKYPETVSGVDAVVPGANSIELTASQINAICNSENASAGTLFFDGALAAHERPQVGKIIYSLASTETLPYGFLGRVTRTSDEDGFFRVETEAVPLNEAFDRLKLSFDVDLLPREDVRTRLSVEKDDEGFYCFSQSLEVTHESVSADGRLMIGAKLSSEIDASQTQNNGCFFVETKLSADVNFKVSMGTDDMRLKIGPPISFAPASKIIAEPVLQLYLCLAPEAELSLHAGASFAGRTKCGFRFGNSGFTPSTEPIGDGGASFSEFSGTAGVSLDGSVFLGITTAFQLRLFGREDMMVAIEPSCGAELSGSFSLDFGKEGIYESLKDTQIGTACRVRAEAKTEADIFGFHTEWKMPLFDQSFGERTFYLFPSFEHGTIERHDDSRSASVEVKRDLLFPSDVGLALYDGDVRIDTGTPCGYYRESLFDNPLTSTFGGLRSNGDYRIWSYVQWGDLFFRAEQLDEELPSIVGTWQCMHIKCMEDGESYELEGNYYYVFNSDMTGFVGNPGEYEPLIYYRLYTDAAGDIYLEMQESGAESPYGGRILELTDTRFVLYEEDEKGAQWWRTYERNDEIVFP